MALPVKKIYVDSAFKESSSTSNSNCSIALRESFYFPDEGTVMMLDDVSIPHSWFSVEVGINDRLFFAIENDGFSWYAATLTSQNYDGASLAAEIVTQMNAVFGAALMEGTDDATNNVISMSLVEPYLSDNHTLGFLTALDLSRGYLVT